MNFDSQQPQQQQHPHPLAARIDKLRSLLDASPLNFSNGVFPLLLDHFALQSEDPVFPLARIMLDESDEFSATGCKTVLVQVHSQSPNEMSRTATASTPSCGPTSSSLPTRSTSLYNHLILTRLADSLLVSNSLPPSQNSPRALHDSSSHHSLSPLSSVPFNEALENLYNDPHSNLAAVESIHLVSPDDDHKYLIVVSNLSEFNLKSLLKYNRQALRFGLPCAPTDVAPHVLTSQPICGDDLPSRLIMMQCILAVQAVHQAGIPHCGLCPEAFGLTDFLWVKLRPPISPICQADKPSINLTRRWRNGELSNFDYLLRVNAASGRSAGGLSDFHAILPWVSKVCLSISFHLSLTL